MMWDRGDPLARIKKETVKANAALRHYALMGPGRSLRSLIERYRYQTVTKPLLGQPPTCRLPTLKTWSTRWDWQARVACFEELQHEAQLEKWEERRKELQEQDWGSGQELREKVTRFLEELPRFIRESDKLIEKDGEIVRVITVALNASLSQIAQALKTASELQRLATDEPTEHIKLSGGALDAAITRELARLADQGKAGIPGQTEANTDADSAAQQPNVSGVDAPQSLDTGQDNKQG